MSRLEQRTDLLLSTLNEYIKAVGGTLQLVATFPGRQPVIVTGFADLADNQNDQKRRAPARGAGRRPRVKKAARHASKRQRKQTRTRI